MKKSTKILTVASMLVGSMFSLASFTGCSSCNLMPNTSVSSGQSVKITMSQTTAIIDIGETLMLSVKVTPEDVTDKSITWKSDNEQIATVANGNVQGVGEGTAIITATSNGRSATCKVTVRKAGNTSASNSASGSMSGSMSSSMSGSAGNSTGSLTSALTSILPNSGSSASVNNSEDTSVNTSINTSTSVNSGTANRKRA